MHVGAVYLHVRRVHAAVEECHVVTIAPACEVLVARVCDDLALLGDGAEVDARARQRVELLEQPRHADEGVVVCLECELEGDLVRVGVGVGVIVRVR